MNVVRPGPLAGIRVADFSRVFAGPIATMMLADLGAEVIKIEDPTGGDDARQYRPPEIGGLSAAFVSLNRNKRSIALDLRSEAGRAAALDLVAVSDVVVENFSTGIMTKYGLDYQAVARINPGAVYCSISAYGRTGPFAARAGYDQICQAESGLMSLTGHADQEPVRTGLPMVDICTGLFAFGAVSAALRERESNGCGRFVEIPLFDTAVCLTSHFGIGYLMTGQDPVRVGNGSVGSQPVGLFEARNGSFMLTIAGERTWRKLVTDVVHAPHIADDPRYVTNQLRMQNKEALHSALNLLFRERDVVDWVEAMRAAGVPAGQVRSVAQAFASPEVVERGIINSLEHPVLGSIPNVRSPVLFDGVAPVGGVPAPLLGEHTEQILLDVLGYSRERIDSLRPPTLVN
jgi:formyl-CoA transferase